MPRILAFIFALMLALPVSAQDILLNRPKAAVAKTKESTEPAERYITSKQLAQCAWRKGGATPEIMKEVANNDAEWKELAEYTLDGKNLPQKQLIKLRDDMRSGNFSKERLKADTQLRWVYGRESGKPKTERDIRVKTNQEAFKFNLDDGYLVFILAKCFNLAMAARFEAFQKVETEAVECSPPTQDVEVGKPARFEALKGEPDCKRKWHAKHGDPDDGEGNVFTTTYKKVGEYEVELRCGKKEVRVCKVVVTAPPPSTEPSISCLPKKTVKVKKGEVGKFKSKSSNVPESMVHHWEITNADGTSARCKLVPEMDAEFTAQCEPGKYRIALTVPDLPNLPEAVCYLEVKKGDKGFPIWVVPVALGVIGGGAAAASGGGDQTVVIKTPGNGGPRH